jgi:hypothetical protein
MYLFLYGKLRRYIYPIMGRQHSLYFSLLGFPLAALIQAEVDTLSGGSQFVDNTLRKPAVFRKITHADLPSPNTTESVDNGP